MLILVTALVPQNFYFIYLVVVIFIFPSSVNDLFFSETYWLIKGVRKMFKYYKFDGLYISASSLFCHVSKISQCFALNITMFSNLEIIKQTYQPSK